MTATDPKIRVPFDKNVENAQQISSKIEKAAKAIIDVSGRVRQNPIVNDSVEMGILQGEMHFGIDLTSDLVAHAKGSSKANEVRMERIAERTPILIRPLTPRNGYADSDDFGLTAYLRKTSISGAQLVRMWGESAKAMLGDKITNTDYYDYCDYLDDELHVAWIEGKEGVLMMEEHNLPIIPIVAQTISGSNLYNDRRHQIQPFLYTALKSHLADRMNLALTMIYYNIFTFGASPTFTFQSPTRKNLTVDWSIPGGVIGLDTGEIFQAMNKQVVNPELVSGLQKAEQLIQDSTIPDTALGQAVLGGDTAFSTIALMNQIGQLPLMQPQRRGSWAFTTLLENIMLILKNQKGTAKIADRNSGVILELNTADIPDNLMIEASLNVDLPQDQRMNALIATQLTSGDRPLVSFEWARSKILGIDQSDDMEQQINKERMVNAIAMATFQQTVAQGMQPPTQPGMTGATPGTNNIAEQLSQQNMGGAQQGLPMTQPKEMGIGKPPIPAENIKP